MLLSDCESALQVLGRASVSCTARLRLGARSLMTPVLQLVEARRSVGFPLAWGHVASHTGSDDVASRVNALADELADLARGAPTTPALSCESPFTFWQDRAGAGEYDFSDELWHVSGDLRASLKKVLQSELVAEWQVTTGSQGLAVRKDPKELALLLHAVRRTRDANLFTFLLRAVTRQTPTAFNNYPELARAGLPLVCPLCGQPERALHPGTCATSEGWVAWAAQRAAALLQGLYLWLAHSGAVSAAHAARLGRIATEVDLSVVSGSHGASLGLLPAGFASRVLPEEELSGPELTIKRIRRELPRRLLRLRLSVLRDTATVYRKWEQRRSSMLEAPTHEGPPNGASCRPRRRDRSGHVPTRPKRTSLAPAGFPTHEYTPPAAKCPKTRRQASPSMDFHQPFSRERVCAVGVFSGLKSHTLSPDDNSTRSGSGVNSHTNTSYH